MRLRVIIALAAGSLLSACAASSPGAGPGVASAPADNSVGQRELSPEEKKAITAAVAPSLRDAASARYHWAKFPISPSMGGSINYCATVDAKSPFAAYDGRQAYIVEVHMAGGRVASATMGLIAGGKDAAIVGKMCAKYGLNPNNAT